MLRLSRTASFSKSILSFIGNKQGNVNKVCTRSIVFSTEKVTAKIISDTGIAEVQMHSRPVNSMGFKFMDDMINALNALETAGAKAAIIKSSIPKIFIAGLDLRDIQKSNNEDFAKFFATLKKFTNAIYSSKLATISAIDGIAVAGGCIAALTTDYRVITPKGSIGLTEIAMGLPLRSSIAQLCASVAGMRNAELMVLTGELLKPEKALQFHVVDEIANDEQELHSKALQQAEIYAKLPDLNAFHLTKLEARKPVLDALSSGNVGANFPDQEALRAIFVNRAEKLKKS